MADNDEQDETEQVPVTEQPQEPVQLAQMAPPTPPAVLSAPPAQPQGAPVVPFTIGRRDPITGEMTTVRGFGQQATPPNPNAQFWNQLRQRTSRLPLAQTEAAVSAALRFQGQRQYQRDLDSGMAPAEALARSAPLIFNAPRQSSLGQAAQFMRAASPMPKFQTVGGVLYRENPDGTATAVTGPAPPKFHLAGGRLYREGAGGTLEAATEAPRQRPQNVGPSVERIRKLETELDEMAQAQKRDVPTGALADETREQLRILRGQIGQSPGAQGATAVSGPRRPARSPSSRRIRVRAPNGKFGTIPESQLETAKAAGYAEVR